MSDVEHIQRTFANAMFDETFQRLGPRRGVWDISRDCERPIPVTRFSRATGLVKNLTASPDGGMRVKSPPMIELVMFTPCRKCKTCLRKRASLWRGLACTEIEHAERTWFGTLTTSPEHDYRLDTLASTRCADFWALPDSKKFGERAKQLGIEATKFLKRIRKETGFQYRYLLVTEIHDGEKTSAEKRGRPHLHMLLHEFSGQPFRKEMLHRQWKAGHSSWKLTRGFEAAWYVSKYISKASDARTRASLGYGVPPQMK